MASDFGADDPAGPRDGQRRRKGKPTTIDLDAKVVSEGSTAAESTGPTADPAGPVPTVDPVGAGEPVADAVPPIAADADGAIPGDIRREPETPSAAEAVAEAPPSATAEPSPAVRGAEDASAQRRGGLLAPLAAAVIGGAVVLTGGAILYGSGALDRPLPPTVAPEVVSALDSRVAALDTRVGELGTQLAQPSAPATDPALAERIAALETALADLRAAPAGTDPALAQRVQDLATRVEALPAEPPIPEPDPRIDQLSEAVNALGGDADALRQTVDGLKASLDEARARLEQIANAPPPVEPARISTIETAIQQIREESSGVGEQLAALTTGLEEAKAAAASAASAAEAAPAAAAEQATGIATRSAEEARAAVEAAAAASRTAVERIGSEQQAVAARVADIEKRLDAGPKGGEIAALSLAITTLGTKIAAGEPFESDLAVIQGAAPDVAEVGDLQVVAAEGVDTIDALRASLPADAMASARPVVAGDGVVGRLMSGAKSLVNYRETGATSEDPLSQAITSIDGALAAGDTQAAAAAAETLPDWAKAAGSDWLGRLQRRATADRALAALTDRVLTRLQAPAEGR